MAANPAESSTHRQTRFQAILETLVRAERVSVDELSAAQGVSPAKIRPDLMLLGK